MSNQVPGGNVSVLMKVEGGEALRKALRKMPDAFIAEMRAAMLHQGEQLRTDADGAAPRASGTLTRSSVVALLEDDPVFVSVGVAYTDPKAPAVHEGIHWRKRKGAQEPGFHWFLRTFNTFAGGYIGRIAARLKRLVGGGA